MAVDLHLVFAMLVMHPVEWHLVKSNDPDAGTGNLAIISLSLLSHYLNVCVKVYLLVSKLRCA